MVKWLKRLLFLFMLGVAIVVGAIFTLENSALISLVLFGHTLPALSVGLWVTIALFVGAVVGLGLSFLSSLFNHRLLRTKDNKIQRLEKELNALRISGVKGSGAKG